jgi:hypothetical protein
MPISFRPLPKTIRFGSYRAKSTKVWAKFFSSLHRFQEKPRY